MYQNNSSHPSNCQMSKQRLIDNLGRDREPNVHTHEEFGSLRSIDHEDGTLWWVATDVCRALSIKDVSMAIKKLDDDEKGTNKIGTPGGPQELTIINEPGLYSLILRSRKPEAKIFKRWVTHDVLPAIRKTGGYIAAGAKDTDDEIMARALLVAQDTLNRRDTRIKALEVANKTMQPKVLFADAVSASTSSILVGELSKILRQNGIQTGQNRLFVWLRENGYLIQRKGSDFNMPTQRSMELGLFEIKERTIVNPDDSTRITKTSKVTGKGQQYFINMFLGQVGD
ncbi:phage antirepressor KilAC domain-containing protein [uncultured Desulfobacter sp.]|uniref:phage antirepressor n=1 Tax=uncultured Desulfobacter sp. TaxID=240139 RepID=UPI002AAB3658|nr:phage antirepressor KilAC domain-containing protein [uncultured Desulfobacter sp.]